MKATSKSPTQKAKESYSNGAAITSEVAAKHVKHVPDVEHMIYGEGATPCGMIHHSADAEMPKKLFINGVIYEPVRRQKWND